MSLHCSPGFGSTCRRQGPVYVIACQGNHSGVSGHSVSSAGAPRGNALWIYKIQQLIDRKHKCSGWLQSISLKEAAAKCRHVLSCAFTCQTGSDTVFLC